MSYLYSGFYFFFLDNRLSQKPEFSAWASCTTASLFYVLILAGAAEFLIERVFTGFEFPGKWVVGIVALILAVFSDWNLKNTWFGATWAHMDGIRRSTAKLAAVTILLVGGVGFVFTGWALYVR